ncbi:hypothetical protein AWB81_07523 [Caballeronia arationis]|uniref:hypothetical protein n=1 Tax=Caballeronia arationis TaxID=1777142 RepID=UPI00074CBDE7|nr:hypothetical protein [Caballeronia arationis]SAL06290.1 hypothetical protein AWB81_07523 [Caballeronia arationis]
MSSVDDRYDDAFMALMRTVLKHVADEETVLVLTAERLIPERLTALGVDMTRRRGELLRGRTLRMALNSTIAPPASRLASFRLPTVRVPKRDESARVTDALTDPYSQYAFAPLTQERKREHRIPQSSLKERASVLPI